jgi:hypothetical protein
MGVLPPVAFAGDFCMEESMILATAVGKPG